MSLFKLGPGWQYELGSRANHFMLEAILSQIPELAHDLPGGKNYDVKGRHDDEIAILTWSQSPYSTMTSFGTLDSELFSEIKNHVGDKRSYSDIFSITSLKKYYTDKSFLLVTSVQEGSVLVEPLNEQLFDWLNDIPLPLAEKLNAARVKRALPKPPQYEVESIARACWVLESGPGCVQGTAFQLDGYGFVTCEHVLFDDKGEPFQEMLLFHSSSITKKYCIRDVKSNRNLDLATFQADIPCDSVEMLTMDKATDIPLHSHVAICGFPNYRLGDTCTLSPGVIVAHRMAKGGVRRMLTNAGIVVGMSGGPAVGDGHKVIGVLATGAAWMQDARETEDQSIIPISALDLLS